MGRFTSVSSTEVPFQTQQQQVPTYSSSPYSNGSSNYSQNQMPGMQNNATGQQQMSPEQMAQMQAAMASWPRDFPKPVIGLDLHGTIIQYVENILTPSQVIPISGSLEAVRMMRLKGHRVMIITDYPGIGRKKSKPEDADAINQQVMNLLGQAGCFSIDGLLYCTTDMREDLFSKHNTGMFKKAATENRVVWKEGWYVGDAIEDLRIADRIGAKPILVKTGFGEETEPKLDSFANRDLKKKVKIFESLLDFARSL